MDDVILLESDEHEFERNINESDPNLDDSRSESMEQNSLNGVVQTKISDTRPKRDCVYEAIDRNVRFEREIDRVKILSGLTPEHIEYMVLRDINYFIDIFSGNCDHSWRHQEYKKFSKKSGNLLYENSAMTSYTYDQYMSAVKALQSIFCKKNNKYDEYIVKVLLPEALIKICMRIYQCSKDAAEEFLKKNNIKNSFADYPKGSAIYSPSSKYRK